MNSAEKIRRLFAKSDVTVHSKIDDRIISDALTAFDKPEKTQSVSPEPNIWRIIMKNPITKLAAAAVIIISVVFLITFFDKAATPAYALEQTIEANHTIKTVHLRMFKRGRSIENNEFSDYWIKYNDAGILSNLRCNEHDKDGVRFTIWNEGIKKTWIPEKNVVFINRLNNMDKEWEDFAMEFEPKFRLQWLYDQAEEKDALEIEIDEPAEDSNSIYVKATHPVHKVRMELVVDRKTKLIKKLSLYRLREQEYELDMRFEFFAYNQPIDPSMFELSGIPDNAKVYDQVNQLVGLEKGDLTNEEIAAKVVREALKATIAKDYGQVRRLMEGDPGDTIEEFIEKEFEARLVRIVSIGRPEEHEKINRVLYFVPCEIEVENEERGIWIVNIIATATAIEYQDNRWIMHTDLRVSGPYILSTKALNEQDRIEGNIIVPGLRVGDYTFGMSKDEVLKKLGEPKLISWEGESYTLNNLPRRYYMHFDDISFFIVDDAIQGMTVHGPSYQFADGLGVGDSEEKIKQSFGTDYQLKETEGKDYLTYDEGLEFEIHKKNRTVREINVTKKISRGHESSSMKPIQSIKPFDDVRSKDLSKLDLSTRKRIIATLGFNQKTVWPEQAKMPPGSDPQKILTDAMNPGLGVRKLHQQGITGKGVNVAIIDQPLFLDHPEFAGKIVAYYDTGCDTDECSMHGPAVASLLVGTNCGTAPDARIYYAAAPSWNADAAYYAKGLDWIIAENEKLSNGKKIRVVSVSAAPSGPGSPFKKNRERWDQACARAKADGIMVLDCTNSHRGFINRGWYHPGDPESVIKFNLGPPPKREFSVNSTEMSLYVPSSVRTTAEESDEGECSYIYWGRAGLSWSIPYCAGVLAMGWQIRPDLTPAQMKEMLFASAYVQKSGARIINPTGFIEAVKRLR